MDKSRSVRVSQETYDEIKKLAKEQMRSIKSIVKIAIRLLKAS